MSLTAVVLENEDWGDTALNGFSIENVKIGIAGYNATNIYTIKNYIFTTTNCHPTYIKWGN